MKVYLRVYGTAASKERLGKVRTRHGLHHMQCWIIPSCCNQYGCAALTKALTQDACGWATTKSRSPSEHLLQHFKFRSDCPPALCLPKYLCSTPYARCLHRKTLSMHLPHIQNGTAPFEGSQTSPVCPYDNSITCLKTSMEQGGMTGRGTPGEQGGMTGRGTPKKKNCLSATLFATISLGSKPDL